MLGQTDPDWVPIIVRLRGHCGFKNVIVMVPFCRTLAEADRVLAVMNENGLTRGQAALQVYMMCEVPSNVIFDERDDAVKSVIGDAIHKAHTVGIRIGICGQGPSNHPDFAQFLVAQGIDSISLNPDSFLRTLPVIAAAEAAGGPARVSLSLRG